jgi:hypothetical protein
VAECFTLGINKWEIKMAVLIKQKYKENLAKTCLILGAFFNPLGFDAAFAFVTKLTGSYALTDIIFYGVALFFFGCYFLLSRKKTKPEPYL